MNQNKKGLCQVIGPNHEHPKKEFAKQQDSSEIPKQTEKQGFCVYFAIFQPSRNLRKKMVKGLNQGFRRQDHSFNLWQRRLW